MITKIKEHLKSIDITKLSLDEIYTLMKILKVVQECEISQKFANCGFAFSETITEEDYCD